MSLGRVGDAVGPSSTRVVGLLAGYLIDRLIADPRRWHPVAGFGTAATALEGILYRDSRWAGLGYAGAAVGVPVALAVAIERIGNGPAVARSVPMMVAVWAASGGTTLARVGDDLADDLDEADLTAARRRLPMLCGRIPDDLDRPALARAGIESIAENTADAAVGVVVWGALFGLPGVVAYRAANTLDAMVGHRSTRYRNFGWAAARADDVLGYPAARLTGLLGALCAPLVGGSGRAAIRVWQADAAAHPSPNAGVCEATWAGALGVNLGGVTPYRYGTQVRPSLGAAGRDPVADDLRRAARLSRCVQVAAVLSAAATVAGVEFLARADGGRIHLRPLRTGRRGPRGG